MLLLCGPRAIGWLQLVLWLLVVLSLGSLSCGAVAPLSPPPPPPSSSSSSSLSSSSSHPLPVWSNRRLLLHRSHHKVQQHQQRERLERVPRPGTEYQFNSRLSINVRNNGGEVFRQTISANVKHNFVQTEFQETDGSFVTQLIDFANNIQLFRICRLGEQDLNEQKVQVFCFVSRLPADQFISSDAVSNLRQKNPTLIRQAEEDRGSETQLMDLEIMLESSDLISPHIDRLCGTGAVRGLDDQPPLTQQAQQPQQRIYANEADLSQWASPTGNRNYSTVGAALRKIPLSQSVVSPPLSLPNLASASNQSINGTNNNQMNLFPARCGEILATIYQNVTKQGSSTVAPLASQFGRAPCHCSLPVCIAWYPCELKYCPNQDRDPASDADTYSDPDHPNSYRCGIKTCRKRYEFRFEVSDKLFCLANFDFDSDQHSSSANSTNSILSDRVDSDSNRKSSNDDDELDTKPKEPLPL